jgi:hypothetical protein
VSVKSGCIEGLDWKGAAHIWTKRAVLQVPEGVEAWEGEPDEGELQEEPQNGKHEEDAQHDG